jgi:putative acetyltransferase
MKVLLTLRSYEDADLPAMMALYRATIHAVCAKDYSREQLAAWAPPQGNLARWRTKLEAEHCVVAVIDGAIVGFCSWTDDGYIDLLYVHHKWPRLGIATALHKRAESALREAGVSHLHTNASVTAQPFFAAQGYRVVNHQTVHIRGADLPNAVMEKRLAAEPGDGR